MKILLLGHKGFLGSYLAKNLNRSLDILEKRDVYDNGNKYDYVINCIGKASLEESEKYLDEANYSNWLIIEDIHTIYPCAKIINFSSCYVYDGEGLNNEESNTTDLYAYTRQKLNGEKAVKHGVSFRLGTCLFGHDYLQKGRLPYHIYHNYDLELDTVLFNATSLSQVLKVINYELEYNNLEGIYNLANWGIIDHYNYGIEVAKILGMKKNIKKNDGKMKRSFHNYGKFLMDLSKINKVVPLTHWKEDTKIKF